MYECLECDFTRRWDCELIDDFMVELCGYGFFDNSIVLDYCECPRVSVISE